MAKPWIACGPELIGSWYALPSKVYLPVADPVREGEEDRACRSAPGLRGFSAKSAAGDDDPADLAGGRQPQVEQVEPVTTGRTEAEAPVASSCSV